jgi:choline dehydrogenase
MAIQTYDFIIVGAGSAGCALAGRLSEDPNTRVLLLETGGTDRKLIVQMPGAVPFAYMNKSIGWGYESGPEPELNARMIDEKRGRLLGGSSSINAMIANRGNPQDYEGWAGLGLPDWSFARCLPYFKKMETFSGGADRYRGGDGPLHIERCRAAHPSYERFLKAAEQAGHAITEDHNGFRQEGAHIAQATIHAGRRWSSSNAYLRPAMARPNLHVRTELRVERILFDKNRAMGVEARGKAGLERFSCEREVILSAGAFGSPQILMLSGLGPADHLRERGIKPIVDIPGVGQTLENHPGVNVQFALPYEESLVSSLDLLGRARLGLEWLLFRRGLGATNFFETGAFLKTRPEVPYPNMQYEFLPLIRFVKDGRLQAIPGFQFWMDLSRPLSRGVVRLRSNNPAEQPSIIFNHLAEEQDARDLVDGVKLARDMASQAAWGGANRKEISPGLDLKSNADLRAWLPGQVGSSYHPSGTCRMGRDEGAVVDEQGRVRGVTALRVVDASIMPRTVTANLNLPIIMMAEKLSDAIHGQTPLPAEDTPYYGVKKEVAAA